MVWIYEMVPMAPRSSRRCCLARMLSQKRETRLHHRFGSSPLSTVPLPLLGGYSMDPCVAWTFAFRAISRTWRETDDPGQRPRQGAGGRSPSGAPNGFGLNILRTRTHIYIYNRCHMILTSHVFVAWGGQQEIYLVIKVLRDCPAWGLLCCIQ